MKKELNTLGMLARDLPDDQTEKALEIIDAVEVELDRLREYEKAAGLLAVEKAELRRENERLRAEAAVGAAIQRACGELPEGFTIAIDLENGFGGVELVWEDERWEPTFDLTFAGQINECVDEAIRSSNEDRDYRDDDVCIDDLIGGNS